MSQTKAPAPIAGAQQFTPAQSGGSCVIAPISGAVTITVNLSPEQLRNLLSFLARSAALSTSFGGEESPPRETNAPTFQSQLHTDAETLLAFLALQRRQAEDNHVPDHAWFTKCGLLTKLGMNRHRKDAIGLLNDLLKANLIEVRDHGERAMWRQYRATEVGMKRSKR